MKNVTRREFLEKSMKFSLGVGFIALGGASLAGCVPKDAINTVGDAKHIVKIALDDPESHPLVTAARKYAEIVSEKTHGEVKVEVYPSSQLGNAANVIEGLGHGTVEAFLGAVTWLGASVKDFWLPGTLYLFNDQDHCRKVHESNQFKELGEQIRSQRGIRVLNMSYDRGPRHIISKNPLEDLDSIRGLKIRVPPQNSWVRNFELASAAPQPIPVSETFTGLQQGIIDATEHVSNWLNFNNYHTIAKNITKTYHNYEQAGMFFSEKAFSSYPKDIQDLLVETSHEIVSEHNELLKEDIIQAEENMKKANVNFIDIDFNEWKTFYQDLIPQLAKEMGYSKEILDSILK